ncbi:MAG: TauD/TfdA family dioxygenase, partial [Betaproteobacteria bacterium]|nr:TauD/TfdA family dioxygenase [Betaproteobacteria bacterium]
HIWLDHDVIMWNNRCTMQADEPFGNITIKRVLHRV